MTKYGNSKSFLPFLSRAVPLWCAEMGPPSAAHNTHLSCISSHNQVMLGSRHDVINSISAGGFRDCPLQSRIKLHMDGFMMLSDPQGLRVLIYILLSLLPFVFFYLTGNLKASKLPTINNKWLFEFSDRRLKQDFARNACQLLWQGLEKYGNKLFKILTDHGTTIILPPEYT